MVHAEERGWRGALARHLDQRGECVDASREGLRFSTGGKNARSAKVLADLAARLQGQIRVLRSLGLRPLAPAKRASVLASSSKCSAVFSYPTGTFFLSSNEPTPHRVPDCEHDAGRGKYVPAELLYPYQELMFGNAIYFHQMFGHGSSPQDSPSAVEEAD